MIDLKKIVKEWKKTIILLFLILLLSILVRSTRILVGEQPIFADEAIYIRWAQVMRAEPTLRFMPLSDGKQPLFMWSIIPLFKIISDPLVAGRLLSLTTGLGTLGAIFIASYLLFKSKKIALVTSTIYALSPFSVFFDSMALVDSMLTMFGLWTFVFALLTAKTLRLDYAMLTGFALGGAALTKSPWIFMAILLPSLGLLIVWPKDKKLRLVFIVKFIILLLVAYFLALALYNILRLGPNFNMIGIRNKDYIFPISHLWQNPTDPFISHIKDFINWLWLLGPSVLILLFILGFISGFWKYKKETFVLFLWMCFPLFVNSMYAKVFTARYILFVIPYVFLFASLAFLIKQRRFLVKILFIIFIVQALMVDYLFIFAIDKAPLPKGERTGYLEEWTAGYGIKETAKYLIDFQNKYSNQKVVVGTEGYFGTLPDGLQLYLNNYPKITVIGVGLSLKEVPNSLMESKKAGNKTFLLINSSRLVGDPQKMGLTLIDSYPKPLRTKNTHDFVMYGPQETLYLFEVD
jgi:4-amino-4-deoxy-L-arabinose transferase-like glycosyltransferase